jgi:hypothetical protein
VTDRRSNLAAPCGLYCGICYYNVVTEVCHGCGCECRECTAMAHADACAVYRCCARERQLRSCAECVDFPCTRLIQFCHDPIWRTHLPILENLRRIRTIGVEAWLDEQAEYWSDKVRRERWLLLASECEAKYREVYG